MQFQSSRATRDYLPLQRRIAPSMYILHMNMLIVCNAVHFLYSYFQAAAMVRKED